MGISALDGGAGDARAILKLVGEGILVARRKSAPYTKSVTKYSFYCFWSNM